MSEAIRVAPARERPPAGGPDALGDPFDAEPAGDRHVVVSSGLYNERLPIAGASVADVRRRLADRLDIDPSAMAVIDGQPVGDEDGTNVQAGQLLAFIRFAGEKGAAAA